MRGDGNDDRKGAQQAGLETFRITDLWPHLNHLWHFGNWRFRAAKTCVQVYSSKTEDTAETQSRLHKILAHDARSNAETRL